MAEKYHAPDKFGDWKDAKTDTKGALDWLNKAARGLHEENWRQCQTRLKNGPFYWIDLDLDELKEFWILDEGDIKWLKKIGRVLYKNEFNISTISQHTISANDFYKKSC